ncbi:hypothetical protein PG997_013689 [Apiospora hydei]|uniref:Uncharacterized protein n=1 Tax=Apiospora hydei TaxID=1337664 RepID=A0ABR1V6X5_9PEZI
MDKLLLFPIADTDHSPRSLSKPATRGDWLPLARSKPFLTEPLDIYFIGDRRHNDCFLSLTYELSTGPQSQPRQARLLAKIYICLRQHMLGDLAGNYAHIRPHAVMYLLLSDVYFQAISSQKAMRDARDDFYALQSWIESGDTWEQAWEEAEEASFYDGRAPSLLSPERLFALLVLEHPKPEYIGIVSRLQVSWMMENRNAVDVQEGFWKGLTGNDIEAVFATERPAGVPEVDSIVDYDKLFGENFPQCCRDIRPFLPPNLSRQLQMTGRPGPRGHPRGCDAEHASPDQRVPGLLVLHHHADAPAGRCTSVVDAQVNLCRSCQPRLAQLL